MEGLILCGGIGKRLNFPYNKCLISFNNKPLIYHHIKLIKKYVDKINIVIKYDKYNVMNVINEYFDNINFIHQKNFDIIGALYDGISEIKSDDFLLFFGDEYYHNPFLEKSINLYKKNKPLSLIGIIELSDNLNNIKNTFSVSCKKNKVLKVIEKPTEIINNIQGTGYSIHNKKILKYIKKSTNYPMIIQKSINNNEQVLLSSFCDKYFNINNINEYTKLKLFERI